MKKYYTREGRRFVQTDLPNPVNNAGMYYQTDGTFSPVRTDDSIGLCIISYPHEHVVMSLVENSEKYRVDEAKREAMNWFAGYGELPTSPEMLTALLLFRNKLDLAAWQSYHCILDSASYAAYAGNFGYAYTGPASCGYYVAALRPILRVKQ